MKTFNVNQVCKIRHAVNVENVPVSALASRYRRSPSTVRRVASGQSYRDIPQARSIPGYSNYLAYPDGSVWSVSRGRFLTPSRKGSSNARYYNLKSNNQRTSIRADEITNIVF